MKAAFLAFDECAVWQVAALQTRLRCNGWAMRTLTLNGETVLTDGGLRLCGDAAIETAAPRDYGLVLLTGGSSISKLADDPRIHRFLRQFAAHGGLIAARGSATLLLEAAGLLGGLHITVDTKDIAISPTQFSRSIMDDSTVMVDGNILTARTEAGPAFEDAVCRQLGIV